MKDKNVLGIFIWVAVFAMLLFSIQGIRKIGMEQERPYSQFKQYLKTNKVQEVTVGPDIYQRQVYHAQRRHHEL